MKNTNMLNIQMDESKKYYVTFDESEFIRKTVELKGFDFDQDKRELNLFYEEKGQLMRYKVMGCSYNDFMLRLTQLQNTGYTII